MLHAPDKPTLSFVQRRFTAQPELSGSTFKKKNHLLLSHSSHRESQGRADNLMQMLREGQLAPSRASAQPQPKVASTGQRATPASLAHNS